MAGYLAQPDIRGPDFQSTSQITRYLVFGREGGGTTLLTKVGPCSHVWDHNHKGRTLERKRLIKANKLGKSKKGLSYELVVSFLNLVIPILCYLTA